MTIDELMAEGKRLQVTNINPLNHGDQCLIHMRQYGMAAEHSTEDEE